MISRGFKIVRLKTKDQLLNEGWSYHSNGILYPPDFPDQNNHITKNMEKLLGKIIPIHHNGFEWIYEDGYYGISIPMIDEEYDIEDYPEYLI